MLKLKSFKIEDGEGASKFLEKFTQSGKSGVLLSNGYMTIPYEDGAAPTIENQIHKKEELRNDFMNKNIELDHILKTLHFKLELNNKQIEEIIKTTNDIKFDKPKDLYEANKKTKEQLKTLKAANNNINKAILSTQAQLEEFRLDIKIYNEEIIELKEKLKDEQSSK